MKCYCEVCRALVSIEPIVLRKDELNEKPWSDVICLECRFVIATVHEDFEGEVKVVPFNSKGEQ